MFQLAKNGQTSLDKQKIDVKNLYQDNEMFC